MTTRIVQITDLHLFKDPEGAHAGVPTWETFRAVLRQIDERHGDFDHLILTGDLAHDEDFETYRMLRDALGDRLTRCRIIPGNHDDPSSIRKVFPDLFSGTDGPMTFSLSAGGWKIIGLDSHLPGEVSGCVGDAQIEWLKGELRNDQETPVLMFIHHPPVAINAAWLDAIGLQSAAKLVQVVEDFPQIEVVCAGHVHQEFTGRIGGTPVYTTPSTCVQYTADTKKTVDPRPAGYRIFELGDGWRTEVHRLA